MDDKGDDPRARQGLSYERGIVLLSLGAIGFVYLVAVASDQSLFGVENRWLEALFETIAFVALNLVYLFFSFRVSPRFLRWRQELREKGGETEKAASDLEFILAGFALAILATAVIRRGIAWLIDPAQLLGVYGLIAKIWLSIFIFSRLGELFGRKK